VDTGFPNKDMRKSIRACPGKVEAGFPNKGMRKSERMMSLIGRRIVLQVWQSSALHTARTRM